jgi:peptidoglycan/LPS O-acetylase OafA/YrhL
MKRFFYQNRNLVLVLGILLLISGALMGYLFYGTEPHETYGGILCGLGFGILLLYFSIRD